MQQLSSKIGNNTAANKPIRAVLFDLDDTLLNWCGQTDPFLGVENPHLANIFRYLQEGGHTLPEFERFASCYLEVLVSLWQEAKKTWAGVSFASALTQLFQELNLDLARIDLLEVMRAYDCRPLPGVTLYEDTIPVLQSVRQQGLKIGLVTNSMLPMWMRDNELAAFNILDYFDARITSGDTGFMKPHPAIYQRAVDLLGITAAEAVFVGDRPANDIAGANAVGMTSVLFAPAHLNRELNDIHPDHIINSLSELLPILEQNIRAVE